MYYFYYRTIETEGVSVNIITNKCLFSCNNSYLFVPTINYSNIWNDEKLIWDVYTNLSEETISTKLINILGVLYNSIVLTFIRVISKPSQHKPKHLQNFVLNAKGHNFLSNTNVLLSLTKMVLITFSQQVEVTI